MAQNNISIAAARGNFLTWCVSGYMPLAELCRPLYVAPMLPPPFDSGAKQGEFYIIYSVNEARELFGAGSTATLMAIQHFETCPELPLYISPLDDPDPGVKAQHTITITGAATDTGILSVDVMDVPFVVAVNVSAPATAIAAALTAQFNRVIDFPFVADVNA